MSFHICQKINTVSLLRVSTLCEKCALDLCVWFCFIKLVEPMVLWNIYWYTRCYALTITWCVNLLTMQTTMAVSVWHFRLVTGMLFIRTWRHAGLQLQIPDVNTLHRSRLSMLRVCLSHGVKLPQSNVYGTCAQVITLISYFPSIPLIPFSPLWEEAAGKALVQ